MTFPEPEYHGEISGLLEHMFEHLELMRAECVRLQSSVIGLEEWLVAHTASQHGGRQDASASAPKEGLGTDQT